MPDALAAHFAEAGYGWDEPTDWHSFTPDQIIEGTILVDPLWPSRWRRLKFDPQRGGLYEVELHLTDGPPFRVAMPFRLDPLPAHGNVILDDSVIDDQGRRVPYWYEYETGDMHLVAGRSFG